MLQVYLSLKSRIVRNDQGASMVEYALLVALIAVVIIAGAIVLGTALGTKFTDFGNTVTSS